MKFGRATVLAVSVMIWTGAAFIARPADCLEPAAEMKLRILRTFSAPPDKVFRSWTDVESIKQWFPHQASVHWSTGPTVDAKVRGHFSWSVVSNGNDTEVFHFHGTYGEYRSPSKLAFTWEWGSLPIPGVEGPGNTLVTIDFVDKGKATAMILTQTGFSGEAARDAHEKGWNRCSDGIEQLLRAKQ